MSSSSAAATPAFRRPCIWPKLGKVVVLEAKEIGFGGAGRNVGLINAGMWVMPDDLPGVLGPVHGERLLDLLGDAPRLVWS